MMARKILYVSGTRADYGLMREVLKKLHAANDIELSLCVTGMHLSSLYGNTIQEIERDGFAICATIPVEVDNTSHSTMSKSIGYEIIGLTEVFEREKPDIVLLLGDRGEMLAAALASVHLNIPVVHLHGGERSGTVDEMVRHAISKLAHYHLVATESSRQRLIRMGEFDNHTFVVGAPGLDELKFFNNSSRAEFCQHYDFEPNQTICLLVYHPVVQEFEQTKGYFTNVLEAALAHNLQIICLEPNSDAGGHFIREAINEFSRHENIRIVKHLHRPEYIDCLANSDVMLGNSSSGIIEAASFNLPVINVGCRQNLRERSLNVIDVDTSLQGITEGIKQALEHSDKTYVNCYGDGHTAERCYQLLRSLPLDKNILNKYNAY